VKRRRTTFAMPAFLAVTSLIALIVGLLGDGLVDLVCWIGIALPLAAIGLAIDRSRRSKHAGANRR
jgi:hypothetical protein